jgi:methylthioribose-1-phosphate isomerase
MQALWEAKGKPEVFNVLTHCNAGWLATVDWGTALSGVYLLQERGVPVHVWVDETRPRNQGARLTAWEMVQQGINHTVIVDNVGGHLMQHGQVDCCIVGTDRTTRCGDVCNKIGTYLKALSAHDNQVPFYVAAPSSSIDWTIRDGIKEIPIEERAHEEVACMDGLTPEGNHTSVMILPKQSPSKNFGFDVTPAKYVTTIFTERGASPASEEGLLKLFPEQVKETA